MRNKLAFAALVLVVSAALFVVWPTVSATYAALLAPLAGSSGGPLDVTRQVNFKFLIPALAVIVSAFGVSWRRRLLFALGLVGGFVAFDVLVLVSGVDKLLVTVPDLHGALLGSALTVLVYHTFNFAFPIAVVLVFTDGKPSRLWGAEGPVPDAETSTPERDAS